MIATYTNVEAVRERLLGELTDTALEVAARYSVHGVSVDQELELWKALGRVVWRPREQRRGRVPLAAECEQLLGELTEAAYVVALGHGFREPFAEVELGLWTALRQKLAEASGRGAVPDCRAVV